MTKGSDKIPPHKRIQQLESELASLQAQVSAQEGAQRQMEKLAARDTLFQYAMEASRDGLWDWDLITDKVYYSPSYLRMIGYHEDHLPQTLQTFHEVFVLPEDGENVRRQVQAALEAGRENFTLEFRMRHKDGQVVWVYCRAKYFERDEQGRPRRCVGVNADITDFVQTQEQLLSAKTQADLANKTKGEFLARMSHEIRTPLNAMVGLGHLLQDTKLTRQQRGYLDSMNAASDSLLHIVNQLLDFSKLETGKIILEHAHFDLELVLERLSRLFEVSAFHRDVEIIYDIDRAVPRFYRGDAPRLTQILSHLVNNALEHSGGKRVLVKAELEHSDQASVVLNFSVTDFGVGMCPKQAQRLLTLLQTKGEQLTEAGAGFGLSICHHLVSLMNGCMHIDTELGRGCSVHFSIEFEHSHIGARVLQDEPHRFENLRALIVDDNLLARDILANTLEGMNMAADSAHSADEALAILRQATLEGKPYDLVLMDYKMPRTNGLQAANLIKADHSLTRKPYVFLISSYHRDEIFESYVTADAIDAFLSKPISESRLFDALVQVFNGQLEHTVHGLKTGADSGLIGVRVLLVEDNKVNQLVALGMLRKFGAVATLAENGREALECLEEDPDGFDVILMDLEMPELDGFEATRTIRAGAYRADIPIVALTAQAMRDDRQRCLEAGMNGYLSKPIKPELLCVEIRQSLDVSVMHVSDSYRNDDECQDQ
ncbi:PAS domain-containing hybrid sensor histidine kinase/response regulator [Marinimicrobium sp. ABcell2]|uniref:PAS domain-containing hybrid sensor histidine kinase/response regulator n=1 Tax=Marinimicrobium sp. ABcell2 TaxID=3069751 RepID=UPI0027B6BF19|nr:PAS domain-containing hybrid sensor histidine kinase/response regulator [Marinimicrobium sp. ABcell2]MDQ2076861.1 response regulator [Marinimicrobium sp. ABcell2]